MLAVRNIPVELNSITSLNSHFSKFGVLVNVQIHFEGDPSSALITFAGTGEAAAAINCTEAIMNNRFIKVFWHIEKQAMKERLGGQNTNPNNVVLGEREETEDVEKVKEDKEKAIQEIQKSQEMLQTKHEEMKKVEEQRKEALAKQEGLLKSKQVGVFNIFSLQSKIMAASGLIGRIDSTAEDADCEVGERQGSPEGRGEDQDHETVEGADKLHRQNETRHQDLPGNVWHEDKGRCKCDV